MVTYQISVAKSRLWMTCDTDRSKTHVPSNYIIKVSATCINWMGTFNDISTIQVEML